MQDLPNSQEREDKFVSSCREILRQLAKAGAATPTEVAIQMRMLPEEIQPYLEELRNRKLVNVIRRKSELEPEMYQVSRLGSQRLSQESLFGIWQTQLAVVVSSIIAALMAAQAGSILWIVFGVVFGVSAANIILDSLKRENL
jgi:hypothetical protein